MKLRIGCVLALLTASACGGSSSSPTAPGGGAPSDVLAVEVTCPASLLIGQRGPCVAVARLRSGQMPLVGPIANWTSTRPDIVAVDTPGVVSGRSAGQASVSASYGGQQAAAAVAVTEEDALRIDNGQAQGGDFRPGSTVTLWLQGYYSVASADTGTLSLRITDQARTITTTTPIVKAKGGDFFLLSSTFVIPADSVEVCRTAVLEVGSKTIAEPSSKSFPLWCVRINRN